MIVLTSKASQLGYEQAQRHETGELPRTDIDLANLLHDMFYKEQIDEEQILVDVGFILGALGIDALYEVRAIGGNL